MPFKVISVILLALAAASLAMAADFQRSGQIDAINLEENTVVVDDIPFQLAKSVVIHSKKSTDISISRLRAGQMIGYKLGASGEIREIWLLPSTYNPRQRR